MNGTQTIAVYQRLMVVFAVGLFGLTWRLWTPQEVFPQVPLFGFLINLPAWVDWFALLVLGASLLTLLVVTKEGVIRSLGGGGFTVSVLMLIAINQHRCQPWAYQFALVATVLALTSNAQSLKLIRALVISIYVYSALGKFDYQFLQTVGQQFLGVLARLSGSDMETWPDWLRISTACSFPTIEMAIGVGLVFQRVRRIAAISAVVMHVMLILILGPLGLNHQWGVIVWNGFFIFQAILLFLVRNPAEHPAKPQAVTFRDQPSDVAIATVTSIPTQSFRSDWCHSAARLLIAISIIFPIGERFEWADHWLGWALYAPHSSRVAVEVAATAIERLPAEVRQIVRQPQEGQLWVDVPISVWSLNSLAAPIYPQARFQLGIAERLGEDLSQFELRATIQSTASRWTGSRKNVILEGLPAIQRAAGSFWLNTHPRSRTALK